MAAARSAGGLMGEVLQAWHAAIPDALAALLLVALVAGVAGLRFSAAASRVRRKGGRGGRHAARLGEKQMMARTPKTEKAE